VDNLLDEMAEEFNAPASQPPAPSLMATRAGSRGSGRDRSQSQGQGQDAQAILAGLRIGKGATHIEPDPGVSLQGAATSGTGTVAGSGQGGSGASKSDAALAQGKTRFKPTKIFQSSTAGFQSNADR